MTDCLRRLFDWENREGKEKMEKEYVKLNPEAEKCMRVNEIIKDVILLVAAIAADYFILWERSHMACLLTGAALLVLAAVCIIIIPRIRYERYRYIIDSSNIRVREGILWIKETIIPMERLHKIQVSQGPVDRMFKLSSVRVTTAGGDGMIKFLADDEAALIVEHLKDKINQIAAEERRK